MTKKGFSVVELLIVVAVLGIVVAMTVSLGPRLGQSSRLNRTMNSLVADINLAKQIASTENRHVLIDFSNDGSSYTLKKQKDIMFFNDFDLDDPMSWEVLKTVKPLEGEHFFDPADITDFAIGATGTVRKIDKPDPANITLTLFIKDNKYAPISSKNIAMSKNLFVFPYGGVKIE